MLKKILNLGIRAGLNTSEVINNNIIIRQIHETSTLKAYAKPNGPTHFLKYNKLLYPPQKEDEPRRPAFVCHMKPNIKYSPKKMWYVASFIRGMSIDEALKQLSFVIKKGSADIKQVLLEAQQMAIKEHNVEFKSNLWVAESFSMKGRVIKGIRRHAKARFGEVRYMYVHYFVRLEEGSPPEDFYKRKLPTPQEQLDLWLGEMRKRKIHTSL